MTLFWSVYKAITESVAIQEGMSFSFPLPTGIFDLAKGGFPGPDQQIPIPEFFDFRRDPFRVDPFFRLSRSLSSFRKNYGSVWPSVGLTFFESEIFKKSTLF